MGSRQCNKHGLVTEILVDHCTDRDAGSGRLKLTKSRGSNFIDLQSQRQRGGGYGNLGFSAIILLGRGLCVARGEECVKKRLNSSEQPAVGGKSLKGEG